MTADQNYRDENPHQGASHSFGKNVGTTNQSQSPTTTTDRERAIPAGRETTGREASRNLGRSSEPTTHTTTGHGYGPFTLMRRLSDDMDRLFENFGFGRQYGTSLPAGRDLWSGNEDQSTWLPQVETFRRGDKFVVRADLPGTNKDDVHAEVEDGVLMISGQRSSEREVNRDDFYRSERSYGSFFRSIPLPEGVESDNCEATFKDGVLEVTLPAPKDSARKAKQIAIR